MKHLVFFLVGSALVITIFFILSAPSIDLISTFDSEYLIEAESDEQLSQLMLNAKSLYLDEVYPVRDIFNLESGTLSAWIKFEKDRPRRDHIIFSTDDSRYVLFVDTYYSPSRGREILRIGARAGGNAKAVESDGSYRGELFPEASIVIDNDGSLKEYGASHLRYSSVPFPENQWHHVSMTWNGYPEGLVRIYLDGAFIGQKQYDSRYDNGGPLPTSMAIGFRPNQWVGELVQGEHGVLTQKVPVGAMRLQDGAIEIKELRLYPNAISQERIVDLMTSTIQQ